MAVSNLAHRHSSRYNGGLRVTVCTCGEWEHDPAGEDGPMVQFAAHVADATERTVREQVAADLQAAGDARSGKANAERDRARTLRDRAVDQVGPERDETIRLANSVQNHAWSLRQQADGLWEAVTVARDGAA